MASRAALYRSRDFAVRFDYKGCRVSITRCTNTLNAIVAQWNWPGVFEGVPRGQVNDGIQAIMSESEQLSVERGFGPMLASTIMSSSFLKGEERVQGTLFAANKDAPQGKHAQLGVLIDLSNKNCLP